MNCWHRFKAAEITIWEVLKYLNNKKYPYLLLYCNKKIEALSSLYLFKNYLFVIILSMDWLKFRLPESVTYPPDQVWGQA
jgi:hypothetical protein